MSFTHLQVRSGYSLFESTITIDKLVKRASELQFTALALTDDEVLYGAISFYQACLRYNIKPIIGMTVNVGEQEQRKKQCILLAKNNNGYKQLLKLSSFIQMNKQIGLTLKELSEYTTDLICVFPLYQKNMRELITTEQAESLFTIEQYQGLFQQGDFYLGVQNHGIEQDLHLEAKKISQQTAIPAVAINDVRYLEENDYLSYDCLQAMKEGRRWQSSGEKEAVKQRHLRSTEEMYEQFESIWPEALAETEAIKSKCKIHFDFNTHLLPSYPVPKSLDAHTYLVEKCSEQVKDKYPDITKEVSDRLTYELKMIQTMGFSDYFLIVADYVNYAKKQRIMVGPGRGSAAGSIVAYILGITNVDPIEYGLLFERFLNPERVSLPDIDVDFSDHRRDEVINYVRSKYGEQHVAQIITFGTFGVRSTLRELFKVMEIDQKDADYLLHNIPAQADQPIAFYVKAQPDLREYITHSKELRLLFTIATKIEGLPRHISTHAAGIVISDKPLIEHLALTTGSNGTTISQFSMHDLEAIGLVKMDFLGLRNLTFLEQIVHSVRYATKKEININQLPLEDEKTYQLLKKGQTNGIFQLESRGMRQVLTQLKPSEFEDIVAVNALYRPGPMEYIATYIKRKHSEEQVEFLHPDLSPILAHTYGVLIYQEQIMQIASKIAGFTLGEADILRRAVSDKNEELMGKQETKFIQGCLDNGYNKEMAEEIFRWIVMFSNYGFNRSHAVAYSKISYQLAYLKAHYPTFFFASLLSSVVNQKDKLYEIIKEIKAMHVSILPPSINRSVARYTAEGESIRVGLYAIQGINHQVIKEIIDKRKQGPYDSLFDFCLRVSLKVINRRVLEDLIMAGAFDETHENRASLLATIDQALNQGDLFGSENMQASLLPSKFGIKPSYPKVDDFNQIRKLAEEKELVGFYVSVHPLQAYRKQLTINGHISLEVARSQIGKRNIQCTVILESIRKIRTKRGDPMAFITLGDETGDMEAVLFPELYRNENSWLAEETILTVTGKVEERNGQIQLLVSTIKPFNDEWLETNGKRLFIQLTKANSDNALSKMKQVAEQFPGEVPILVYYKEENETYKLAREYNLAANTQSIQALKAFFGDKSVVLST